MTDNTTAVGAATVDHTPSALSEGPRNKPGRRAELGAGRSVDLILTLSRRYAIVGVLVAVVVASNVLYPGFFASGNIKNILSQNAPVGIVAVGMTFVIIAGGFDLSVGAVFAASGVAFASYADKVPLWQAAIVALLVGATAGTVNGIIVTKLQVNPFVATLGSSSVFGGLAFLYSESAPIIPMNQSFRELDTGAVAGVPYSIIIFAAVVLVGALLLSRSVLGRSVYAVGGNDEAARLAGMRVDRIRIATYVITGLCAAVAGLIVSSRTGLGQADSGASITLDAIAIVIIGGTSLMGGEGAMWRTVVGLAILATINNLFDSLALDTAAQSLVKGLIVIGAVALDSRTRRRT